MGQHKQRLLYDYVENQIEKPGYKLLSNSYKNAHDKLKVECPKGHQYNVNFNNFKQGKRCPFCEGSQKLTYNYVKSQIEKTGYKLLSNSYKNYMAKLKIECSKGHQYKVTYSNFKKGRRCPVCWKLETYSRSEKDCLSVVKQLTNEDIIENDRTQIINPKTNWNLELDIFIPSLKKAVEFNGEYWHKNRKFEDKQKQIQCKEKFIDLIIIKYQDWINNRDDQTKKLKDFLKG